MSNDTLLSDAVFYMESTYLRVMIFVRVILACLSLVLLTVLQANRRKFVAHRSLTVLINIHTFWVFVLCVSIVNDHAYTIYLLSKGDPIKLIHTDSDCILRFTPHMIAVYGSICSMFMMTFERFTASNNLGSYEQSHKYYGYTLAAWHMLMVALLMITLVTMYGHEGGETASCSMSSPKGKLLHNPVAGVVLFSMEGSTIAAFVFLLRKNEKRLNCATIRSLTERYQVSENVRMIRIMLPVVASHVAITTLACIVFFPVTYGMKLSSRYAPLMEDSINLFFLQGISIPFFFLRQFRYGSRHTRKVRDVNTASAEKLTTTHISVIQGRW